MRKRCQFVPEFNDGIYMHCEYEKDALCARIKFMEKNRYCECEKDALCARI